MTRPFAGTWRDRIQRRLAERQLSSVLAAAEQDLRPKTTISILLAQCLALVILATPLVLASLAIWVLYLTGASILGCIVAAAFGLIAWLLVPPVNRIGDDVHSRGDLPKLFGLVDAIAEKMGAPRIDGIVISTEFNAFIAHSGWRRQRILGIGLVFWQVLTEEERVAVISHELAHEINGDPARSGLIRSAEQTLIAWIDVLTPSHADPEERGLILLLADWLMHLAAFAVTLVLRCLFLLRMRLSQRAEYYADLLAARTAGTGAMITSLHKTVLHPVISDAAVFGWSREEGAGRTLMTELRARIYETYGDKVARLTAKMEDEKSTVDDSHPPTLFRISFLTQHDGLAPQVVPDQAHWTQIKAEIEPFLEPAGKALLANPDDL